MMRPDQETLRKKRVENGAQKNQRDPKIQRLLVDPIPKHFHETADPRVSIALERLWKNAPCRGRRCGCKKVNRERIDHQPEILANMPLLQSLKRDFALLDMPVLTDLHRISVS